MGRRSELTATQRTELVLQLLRRKEVGKQLARRVSDQLWQTDITWVHAPGSGYWYAVTVIDYYSRYLLTCHLSGSHTSRDVQQALGLACEEAERCVCGWTGGGDPGLAGLGEGDKRETRADGGR